jgi:hypothetical protein
MKPSSRPARSSVRNSARARAGSKWRQTIAWKHESQYHWCRYRGVAGQVNA